MAPRKLVLSWLAIGLTLTGCGSCSPAFRECEAIDPDLLGGLPERLSETGLFSDVPREALGPGVRAFTPHFELWSDGAEKRRWLYLPPGSTIDTSDPNAWVFPVGTKAWKEFSRDGVRIETRLLIKSGADPDGWTPVAYVWRDDGDAMAAPDGVVDARGTTHDVPSASACMGCHAGTKSVLLGVSAVQLPKRASADRWSLDALADAGLLSDALPAHRDVPGDETTHGALGLLHANCGHCHNRARPARNGLRCFDPDSTIDFALRVGELDNEAETATYRTAVGRVVLPGDPDDSEVLIRMRSRDPWWGMPALGTERVDHEGASLLEAWIRNIEPR